jgi:hypothetical protein
MKPGRFGTWDDRRKRKRKRRRTRTRKRTRKRKTGVVTLFVSQGVNGSSWEAFQAG